MKILVPIKQVATLDEDFELRDDGRDVDPDYFDKDLNEWDEYSVEEALLIKEASSSDVEVIVVTVGPDDADEALRKCLAKGADRAVRVWDDALEESDSLAIARVLARVAEKESPDMVFAGTQSSDAAYSSTGVALAAFLDWPHAAVVSKLDYAVGADKAVFHRELEGGLLEEGEIQCPCVLTIQLGINAPRYASLRGIKQAKSKQLDELSLDDLGLSASDVGAQGSASRVRRVFVPEKGQAELIGGTAAEQAERLARIIKEMRGM